MKTAVQLRSPNGDSPRCALIHGEPAEVVVGRAGPVALFGPDELVAYVTRFRRRTRIFVFRTLLVDDPLAVALPGVHPRVRLLLSVHSVGRARLVARLFAYLRKTRWDPARIPDVFYLRVGLALGGRLPAHRILLSLLSASATTAGIAPVHGGLRGRSDRRVHP